MASDDVILCEVCGNETLCDAVRKCAKCDLDGLCPDCIYSLDHDCEATDEH